MIHVLLSYPIGSTNVKKIMCSLVLVSSIERKRLVGLALAVARSVQKKKMGRKSRKNRYRLVRVREVIADN